VSEPGGPSDALSGADGTQLPDPMPVFPDSLAAPETRRDQDVFGSEPVGLPALPDERAVREAIAAALGDEPPARAQRGPAPPGTGRRPAGSQRVTTRPAAPVQRGPAGSAAHRAPTSGPSGSFLPVAPADLRRRISRDVAGGPLPGRWTNRGCFIAIAVIALIVFSFLAGFAESVARLLQ
jgi:hypothetical protein